MKNRYLLKTLLLTVIMLLGLSFTALADENEETLPEGIYLEDIALSGMTPSQVKEQAEQQLNQLSEKKLTVYSTGESGDTAQEFSITYGELGLHCTNLNVIDEVYSYVDTGNLIDRYKNTKDVEINNVNLELEYSLDINAVTEFIGSLRDNYTRDSVEAEISKVNGVFQVTQSSNGLALDESDTINNIMAAANSDTIKNGEDISTALSLMVLSPNATTEDLSTIQDVLGTFWTSYTQNSSQAGRNANLVLGTSLINGAVVMPGETYSANAAMEPYEAALGWREAASYTADGGVEQSLGGGICQISTTFYNAALEAELGIVQRQPHSMTVGYVDYGFDAAIAGTWKDLVIQNTYPTPIYIECSAVNGKLTFTIYGQENRASNRTIEFFSVAPGVSYSAGGTATAYKIIKIDGVEVERINLGSSTYKAANSSSGSTTPTEAPATETPTENTGTTTAATQEPADTSPETTAAPETVTPETPETPTEQQQNEDNDSNNEQPGE